MPRALIEREIGHESLTELHVVETMHERKTRMAELGDAFAMLPGGAGTLEEAFEQWTWAQLGIHAKSVGFPNAEGYFEPLMAMIERMVDNGFLDARYRDMLVVSRRPEELLDAFAAYAPPERKGYERPIRS